MSKRRSGVQSNTLFSYFKSPVADKTRKVENGFCESRDSVEPTKNKEQTNIEIDGSDDEISIQGTKKRNRPLLSDSESENENKDPSEKTTLKQTKKPKLALSDTDSDSEKSPKQTPKKSVHKLDAFLKNSEISTPSKRESESPVQKTTESVNCKMNWLHERLSYMQPDSIRDSNKRKPGDPQYDPHTLFVPEKELNNLTPAMRQWWVFKSQHMDCVLFFKVGKFYELYHMDAVVGVKELGLSFMKGDFAHSGFPESAYAKMASVLIDKGYKVARVEQTETPEMMNERCKKQGKSTKFDKVVRREICQISTKATFVSSAQMPEAVNEDSCYMHAVVFKKSHENCIRLGVCFVETSIGTIYLAEFDDDKHFSRLLSLFAEYPPGLILTERGTTDKQLKDLLNTNFKDVNKDTLSPGTQFYTANKTLEKLSSECYFRDADGEIKWPKFFERVADNCIPKAEYELALKSLGGCMWYLKDSELDIQVISMGKFEMYHPLDVAPRETITARDHLVLDSVTLTNLNILGAKGTLQNTLDRCETLFGKRLLLQWICRPLCSVEKIKERQLAVDELWNNPEILRSTRDVLKTLPDLERQIAKLHTYGNKFYATEHPDSRAIFYDSKTYSKRKIIDLLKTLRGFEKAQDICDIFKDCHSLLLKRITQRPPSGLFLDLQETLNFFKCAFNHDEAEKEGKIVPKEGIDQDYDNVQDTIKHLNQKLDEYLSDQSKYFGCKVQYAGTDKKRFQLEIPDTRTHKVTGEYQLEGTRKGFKKYTTSTTKELLADMIKAETERAKVVLDLNRRIVEKFSEKQKMWEQVVCCLAMLDVLCSFAEYARTCSQDMCMPKINGFCDDPKISIENGIHPCLAHIDKFVPNDVHLGHENFARFLILTGPNMGGKSTLMRQVAILVIMAQMGCCVPATNCEINLVDRIFTRIGAQDDIVQGHSTFFVELSEASSILKHASANSLVLIDELGRGTSTYDGSAIATAYVNHLMQISCRTVFSTHYHSLIDNFIDRREIQLGHMACMVESSENSAEEVVTLLYKLIKGRCPKSYGFNAARIAGLKQSIISRGFEIAKELEEANKRRHLFKQIFCSSNFDSIMNSIVNLSVK